MYAAQSGFKGIVIKLIPLLQGQQDKEGMTAFLYACECQQYECAMLLIDEANMADKEGRNGLMAAAKRGYISIVKKIQPQLTGKQDKEGNTAFYYACWSKH